MQSRSSPHSESGCAFHFQGPRVIGHQLFSGSLFIHKFADTDQRTAVAAPHLDVERGREGSSEWQNLIC